MKGCGGYRQRHISEVRLDERKGVNMESVQLYGEPVEIIRDIKIFKEMTFEESAYICGLIKDNRPKIIVEVGVAAGGTSAVILNCIRQLKLNSRLYSIDKREEYYRDQSKEAGYITKELVDEEYRKNHKLYKGKLLPEVINEIEEKIDLIILDTIHRVPGEILDFLACLPYLNHNAVVVLHDICFNQIRDLTKPNIREVIGTNVLFATVAAEKYLNKDKNNLAEASNIGAFRINEDTKKYIENVFLALLLNWSYMPGDFEILQYMEIYKKNYSEDCCKLFEQAVLLNRNFLTMEKRI